MTDELSKKREEVAKGLESLKVSKSAEDFSYPSVFKLALNLAQSAKDAIADPGDFLVEEEESLDRLGICLDCELLDPFQVRCTHESCGCFLHLKTHLGSATCPLLLWPGDAEKVMLRLEADNG